MSRIAERFQQLAGQGRKALVPYVVAGDPSLELTVPLMHALVDAGADILELGVPFSDPMSEGPTIQLAHELRDTPIKVNSADPGYVATDLNHHTGTRTVEQGARIAVELATLPADGPTGGFFDEDGVVPW